MIITFETAGGPQVVDITNNEVAAFIDSTKNLKNQYGAKPEHPLDYIEIAGELEREETISKEKYERIVGELKRIIIEEFK